MNKHTKSGRRASFRAHHNELGTEAWQSYRGRMFLRLFGDARVAEIRRALGAHHGLVAFPPLSFLPGGPGREVTS